MLRIAVLITIFIMIAMINAHSQYLIIPSDDLDSALAHFNDEISGLAIQLGDPIIYEKDSVEYAVYHYPDWANRDRSAPAVYFSAIILFPGIRFERSMVGYTRKYILTGPED